MPIFRLIPWHSYNTFEFDCWSVNENCDVNIAIYRAFNVNDTRKKAALQGFFVPFTRPALHSGIYGIFILPLMLLTPTAKKKNYLRTFTFAGFTKQRTAFTLAQSTILQSQDFNLRVQRALKFIYEANISKIDQKIIQQRESDVLCEIQRKTCGVELFTS